MYRKIKKDLNTVSYVANTRSVGEHKSHKGLQTNFKWFIVAFAGGSGAFRHLTHASSGC